MVISVVSGTYNRLALLKKMIASARQSVGDLPYEIVLVDGGSTDGTLEWCRQQPDVVLIEQGRLLGAIKAYNAGYNRAQGRYVVTGNDDIAFNGDTLKRAYDYLEANPEMGMVAFRNVVPDKSKDQARIPEARARGYPYGQCCMVRHWLGEWAGWWGAEGMRTYGGDTRLSLRLWEMGWPTVYLDGCSITDRVHNDELRRINSDAPWEHARKAGKLHPDLVVFNRHWPRNRLPVPDQHIPAIVDRVLMKAAQGNLRTIRFKAMYRNTDEERTGMIDAFAQYGPTRQINQSAEAAEHGVAAYQKRVAEIISKFRPDLVMLQARSGKSLYPDTALHLRERHTSTLFANFDGDTRYPLREEDFALAKAVHLQLIISPSLFGEYAEHGAGVAYWPIAPEQTYLDAVRPPNPSGPDVAFLGSLFGLGAFPCAGTRRDAVLALTKSGLSFKLFGHGWDEVDIRATSSYEKFATNAQLYATSKMALSISQSDVLWGYTSNRLYDICATGCPALVYRFAGMGDLGFVDSQTCIVWGSIPEMLEKVRYYLAHDVERETIGAAGRELIRARHTWSHRVESLFAIIEGLKGGK